MSEPTARPWVVDRSDEEWDELAITTAARIENSFIPIAKIQIGFAEPMDGEQEANAALIVAAVNAYPALEEAAAALEGVIRVADRNTVEFDEARAALSRIRATGGE